MASRIQDLYQHTLMSIPLSEKGLTQCKINEIVMNLAGFCSLDMLQELAVVSSMSASEDYAHAACYQLVQKAITFSRNSGLSAKAYQSIVDRDFNAANGLISQLGGEGSAKIKKALYKQIEAELDVDVDELNKLFGAL